MNAPPFTWIVCPVMKRASSEQRKRTIAAISSGRPLRPIRLSGRCARPLLPPAAKPRTVSIAAGHDDVDGHVVAAEFLCQRARQSDHAGLGRDRMHAPDRTGMRRDAADVHNAAAARGDDMRCRGMRAVERSVQRGAKDLAPFRRRDLGEFGLPAQRGVVDQDIQSAKAAHRRRDQARPPGCGSEMSAMCVSASPPASRTRRAVSRASVSELRAVVITR